MGGEGSSGRARGNQAVAPHHEATREQLFEVDVLGLEKLGHQMRPYLSEGHVDESKRVLSWSLQLNKDQGGDRLCKEVRPGDG